MVNPYSKKNLQKVWTVYNGGGGGLATQVDPEDGKNPPTPLLKNAQSKVFEEPKVN